MTEHERAIKMIERRMRTTYYVGDRLLLKHALSVLTVYPGLIDAARDDLRHHDCKHTPRDPEHCTTCRLAELSGYEPGA